MNVNINLENINIVETYNIFYVLSEVGSNLNINNSVLIQYGGDFNVDNVLMTLTLTNPFNKQIWVVLKEKNGEKFLTKNIYIDSEDFFDGCINCCLFIDGSFVFNEWEIDCDYGVGVVGSVECKFSGGSYIFDEYNYDCNFNVYVVDSNVRPNAKITKDLAGTDTTDLISQDTNIQLYCVYVETFNGSTVLSSDWQFRSLTYGGGWITSTQVTINQLQNYPTGDEDFEFRVKVVDSNGLVGYSNSVRKYYIDVI